MKKRKYITPSTKLHTLTISAFLTAGSYRLNSTGSHSKKDASTEAASRLGSSIWDEEEADEDF